MLPGRVASRLLCPVGKDLVFEGNVAVVFALRYIKDCYTAPVKKMQQSWLMKAFLDSPFDALALLDEDGRFEYANKAFLDVFEVREDDLIGKGFTRFVPPEKHRTMLERWNEVLNGNNWQDEFDIVTALGHRRTLLVSQHRLPGDPSLYVVFSAKDVTAKRLQEEEQAAARQQLEDKVRQRTAALVEINARLSSSQLAFARAQSMARTGSWEWDLSCNRPEWSGEMFRLYGLDPEKGEPTMERMLKGIHPQDRDRFDRLMKEAIESGRSFQIECRLVRDDGTVTEVQARVQVQQEAFGQARRLSGTLQDVTERRRLEREVVDVSRYEQQRIGRDIHDTLGQELTGLSLMAKALENQVRRQNPALGDRVSEVSRLASLAARRARDIAHGLSPVDIEADGLCAELQRMCSRMRSLFGVDCQFSLSGDDRVYDNAVATHLYHIVQEAMTNAVKHASPSAIRIDLINGDTGLLTVTDDGCGMQNASSETTSGIGLRIMRHRAEIIGAQLTIGVAPNGGTCVTCTFPNQPESRYALPLENPMEDVPEDDAS